MIDLQSYIVKECGILDFNVGILNVHHVRSSSVIDEEGVINLLQSVSIVLNVHCRPVICPILLECAILASEIGITLYIDSC